MQRLAVVHLCDREATLKGRIPYGPEIVYPLCALQQAEAAAHAADNSLLATARLGSIYRARIPVEDRCRILYFSGCFDDRAYEEANGNAKCWPLCSCPWVRVSRGEERPEYVGGVDIR